MSYLWDLSDIQPENKIVMPGETMPAIFWNAVKARGPSVWMRQKSFGIWRSWTWQQTGDAVSEIAHGLMALGFQPRETASILSNTTVEWVLCDLAVLSAGGVSNGIYPTDAAEQVEYLCADSRTTVLFVEDDEQLDKALEVRERLPLLKKIIVEDMEGLRDLNDPQVMSLAALRELGRAHAREHAGELAARVAACQPDDLAILVYTSGTTGRPKGAMHSHSGLVYTVRGYNTLIARNEADECMCFLPLCHIAERMGGEYFSLYTGAKLNFVENPETVPENVREIAPTVFTAVPRVWEKFYSGVMITLKEASKLQQVAYGWAIGVGQRVADHVLKGEPVPGGLKLQFRAARLLVLDNVRKIIGIHRARFLVTGAAPISPDLVRWYLALGVPMLEVWGMTETCGASTGVPAERMKPGSIGPAAQYNEVRLDPQTGEILVRGPNVFMGYLNLPDKTAETIDADGWLHTGDVGVVDEEGFFRITDRMKDIIITAGGERTEVLALRDRRRGDRRQEALPHRDHHDRPGQRGEICAGPGRAVLQLRQSHPRARSAGADPVGDRPCEQEICPGRTDQEVLPARHAAQRRRRGTDPDHETQTQAGAAEVRAPDRRDVQLNRFHFPSPGSTPRRQAR